LGASEVPLCMVQNKHIIATALGFALQILAIMVASTTSSSSFALEAVVEKEHVITTTVGFALWILAIIVTSTTTSSSSFSLEVVVKKEHIITTALGLALWILTIIVASTSSSSLSHTGLGYWLIVEKFPDLLRLEGKFDCRILQFLFSRRLHAKTT